MRLHVKLALFCGALSGALSAAGACSAARIGGAVAGGLVAGLAMKPWLGPKHARTDHFNAAIWVVCVATVVTQLMRALLQAVGL